MGPTKMLSSELMETLINHVRMRPLIWDGGNVDHRDHSRVTSAWRDIYACMSLDFDHLEEIVADHEELKVKWGSLRDQFRKLEKKHDDKKGFRAKKRVVKWRWFHLLGFLSRENEGETSNVNDANVNNDDPILNNDTNSGDRLADVDLKPVVRVSNIISHEGGIGSGSGVVSASTPRKRSSARSSSLSVKRFKQDCSSSVSKSESCGNEKEKKPTMSVEDHFGCLLADRLRAIPDESKGELFIHLLQEVENFRQTHHI